MGKSSGLKRLRFNESDLERSIYAAAATAGSDANASDLFNDYFNPSTSHAVIATYAESTLPSTSAAAFLRESAASTARPPAKSPPTTEGSPSAVVSKSKVAEAAVQVDSAPVVTVAEKEPESDEFIPELSDQQRKQLDEQLRNVMNRARTWLTT